MIPDDLMIAINQAAHKEGQTRNAWLVALLSEHLSLDILACSKCGKIFSIEDEGTLRDEGAFCEKHRPKEEDQ